jgi:Ala-tRNA(Pro) deacylase
MIKVVVVRIDGRLALAAVPASRNVDTEHLRAAAEAHTIEIAEETEFALRFPGCHLGAMPPLGAPFGMDVYMERDLAKEKYIAFTAGTHSEVIAMEFGDYRRVAHPKLAHISAVPQDSPLLTAQI